MNTIERTLASMPAPESGDLALAVKERWDLLTKPRGSLGVLESCIVKLAAIQGSANPRVERRCVFVFCGDHGVTEEGVSLYPSVVTREMVKNFVRGGAAINVLCAQLGITTRIVDAGVVGPKFDGVVDRRVAEGTKNFARLPAMSRDEASQAVERGILLAADAASEFDLVGLGEMGIGNTTSASAILCAMAGATPEEAAGRGTGLDDEGVQHKCDVLRRALALHAVNGSDSIAVLAAFGGFEIAMMAGFLLGAARHRLAVVVDGFIGGAAFLVARGLYPALSERVFFGHKSAELAHARLLRDLAVSPLLDLGMRLGEGTGAALAVGLLTSAAALYCNMATFTDAAVTDVQV